jgi:xanthosine utilization system XapX-like protein
MSMTGAPFSAGSAEAGETVASFTAYEAAQKAVSRLIAADVPAREIAIVGQGLRSVERVTGRLGYAAAARSGAVNGLVLGVLFAAVFVLGSPVVPIQAFVGVLFLGIAVGMLLSLITYAVVRRRRDYSSVMQVAADHYEVKVAAGSVQKARAALGAAAGGDPAPATSPASSTEPPRYGERATGEPPRYGERVTGDEPPRYGERVTPAPHADEPEPPSAAPPASTPDGASTADGEDSAQK